MNECVHVIVKARFLQLQSLEQSC